ncbi:MAG: translation elongation factor Ts [Candidatus Gracilibacteria bacterium]|nr:translation elongation factor Ts [Candidatus Gracilibacteria bacterium]
MAISMDLIKELRERTGIGMMECKKALEETNGDMELAIEELRKKGLAKAAKKADRETAEGGIKIEVEGGKVYVVSVSCETDFLANSDKFKTMLADVVNFLKENGEATKEAAQEFINKNYALELGENLQLRDYKILSGEKAGAYVHSNGKLAAVVLAKTSTTDEEKLKQVAMHVTASSPEYLSTADISEEVVEKEKAIQLDIMKNDPKMANKPEDVLLKIIEGKMGKFKDEISLLEQAFVMNPDIKIKDFIGADSLSAFEKFSV